MDIRFGTASYRVRSRPLSSQRMLNCYLEVAPPASKSPVAVVPSYGITAFATPGTGPLRGACTVNGTPYVVSGSSLYAISQTGVASTLGTIPGLGVCELFGDGINVVVTTAGTAYVYNGSTVAQVTDADFPGATWSEYLDGYWVFGEPNSGRVWVAGPLDPTNINALDFATAEGAPDDTLDGIVDHREVFLFGRESTEVWFNSGNADFPLERAPSGFIETGILSPRSAGKVDNSVFFPGHDCLVYRLQGYQPVRISTEAVEQAIESYADKTCEALTWAEGGHKFYALKFAEGTWVYDVSTQLWHERQSYGLSNWRPAFILRAYNRWLVGDSESNRIGYLNADVFTEFGEILTSSCTAPSISQENQFLSHDRLELLFEQGVGLITGQGSDPQVMLQFSDDGGRTWSNEKWRGLGRIGEYKHRVIWNRLGQSRDRVYRYAISDPVRRTLIGATLNSGLE